MSWLSWTSLFNRHQILEPKPLCGKFTWQWKLLSCAKLQLRVELVRSNWWSHRNSSGPFLPPIVLEKDRFSCSWCSWHWWQAQWRPGNHLRRSSERLLQFLVQMQILSDSIFWLLHLLAKMQILSDSTSAAFPQRNINANSFFTVETFVEIQMNYKETITCWIIWIPYKKFVQG